MHEDRQLARPRFAQVRVTQDSASLVARSLSANVPSGLFNLGLDLEKSALVLKDGNLRL